MSRRARLGALAAAVVLAGCGGDPATLPGGGGHDAHPGASATSAATPVTSGRSSPTPVGLRDGERFVELRMPHPYTPKAPTTGTDDYRCFLLDPKLTRDSVITGTDFLPANSKLVHHVILYKIDAEHVRRAEARDDLDAGDGWTCFGGTGIDGAGDQDLTRAPWLGAWAPGGSEEVAADGIGTAVAAGSRIVMQVHYTLLAGSGSDQSAARLRIAADGKRYRHLHTLLLPAPVELPCRPGRSGPLCDRDAAMADNTARFGMEAARANLMHVLCGAEPVGPTQQCTRPVGEKLVVRATAGHMHLLGKAIRIVANAGTARERTLLDVPVWNFDDQRSIPLDTPVTLNPTDTLTVTCTHDQSLRDRLPALAGTPERYVVWGEGTADEMCLGIVLFTTS